MYRNVKGVFFVLVFTLFFLAIYRKILKFKNNEIILFTTENYIRKYGYCQKLIHYHTLEEIYVDNSLKDNIISNRRGVAQLG